MATIRDKMGHFIQMIAETTDLMRNLVPVTNAIIVWNTVYMQAVIEQLKQQGYVVNESDLQHISPCRFGHLNKMENLRSMLKKHGNEIL